jgi:hypothetical protein
VEGFETGHSVEQMWVQLPASRKARADWLPLAEYPKRHAFASLGVRKSGSERLNTSDKPEGAGLQIQFYKYNNMLELLSVISLGVVLFVSGTLWALWVLYIAMMNIKRVAEAEPMPIRVRMLVYPTMAVFEVVEFVANVVVLTVLFVDWPREIRVSDRLRRYWRNPYRYGWRLYVVRFLKPMLDPFDPAGPHI